MMWHYNKFLLLGLMIGLCLLQINVQAGDRGEAAGQVKDLREQQHLWNRAVAFLEDGNKKEAAPLFRLLYESYPASEKAEDALWNAARLKKHLALDNKDADWDEIKDLYREFTVAYPESERLPQAYLEVGKSYMKIEYYREAVPYFGLILRRFPDSKIVEEASILKSRALYKTGRVDEAVAIYRELGKILDKNYERLANGYQYYGQEKYHDALGSFLKILKRDPSFYLKEPDILRIMGNCYLQTGQTALGRGKLEHYLNLGSGSRGEDVLFQIGESYLEEGKKEIAAKFYGKALQASKKGERIYSFCKFRLTQLEEEKKKAKPGEKISKEKFIKVREAVLEHGNTGKVIQEARLELIDFYWNDQEINEVLDLGRIYLNYDGEESGREKIQSLVCGILDNRLEEMLSDKRYGDIYQLYQDEYPYIKNCKKSSVRIKVGKALQKLSLFDKASVVYWRAMNLEMTPEEKKDLYLHRAETYLAGKAFKSADTLLTHLRRVYRDDNEIGDIYFLSGKLSEIRSEKEKALGFYEEAAGNSFYHQEKQTDFAEKYLGILLENHKVDKFSKELKRFGNDQWFGADRLQYWYVRLGDYYQKFNKPAKAGNAYQIALADNMPKNNEIAQKANLYYGDVQFTLGNLEKAVGFHKKALNGPDKLLTRIARQRLEEDEMTQSISEME